MRGIAVAERVCNEAPPRWRSAGRTAAGAANELRHSPIEPPAIVSVRAVKRAAGQPADSITRPAHGSTRGLRSGILPS
jgi:hypothetical protein